MRRYMKSILIMVMMMGLTQLRAEEPALQFVIGYVMDSTSLNINSRGPAMETTGLRAGGHWVPGLLARSQFNRRGNIIGFDYGYYFEYGLDSLSMKQGQVWNYSQSQYVDPVGRAHGWYAQAHQIFAIRSAGMAMGIGVGITYLTLQGNYMVDWWDHTNSYEYFNWQTVSFNSKLFIEGESDHWLWGLRLNSMSVPDDRFYYDLSIVSIYLGYKL